VSRAVGHPLDPTLVSAQGGEDPSGQFDVGELGVGPDVVDLAGPALVDEEVEIAEQWSST
jgi:hypothetical protein